MKKKTTLKKIKTKYRSKKNNEYLSREFINDVQRAQFMHHLDESWNKPLDYRITVVPVHLS